MYILLYIYILYILLYIYYTYILYTLQFDYAGGLKIWECTFDLGQYILEEQIELKDKRVMDLGCGAGLIGLIALLKDSTVHFQDYVRIIYEYYIERWTIVDKIIL